MRINRRKALVLLSMLAGAVHTVRGQLPRKMDVFKDASCGCCGYWVAHLRKTGFQVTANDVTNLNEIKDKHRVPAQTRSCHTGLVEGYVIEGHVPAADVHRLLKEKPAGIIGLAVPGMPIGSPGMEGANPQPYDVLAFDREGRTKVFASHGPRPR